MLCGDAESHTRRDPPAATGGVCARKDLARPQAAFVARHQRLRRAKWGALARREFRSDHSRRRALMEMHSVHRSKSRQGEPAARTLFALDSTFMGGVWMEIRGEIGPDVGRIGNPSYRRRRIGNPSYLIRSS